MDKTQNCGCSGIPLNLGFGLPTKKGTVTATLTLAAATQKDKILVAIGAGSTIPDSAGSLIPAVKTGNAKRARITSLNIYGLSDLTVNSLQIKRYNPNGNVASPLQDLSGYNVASDQQSSKFSLPGCDLNIVLYDGDSLLYVGESTGGGDEKITFSYELEF